MRSWLAALLIPSIAFAIGVNSVTVTWDQSFNSPRWMFDRKAKVKGEPLIEFMVEAKRALMEKNRARCLAAVQKIYPLGASLGPWILWNHLQCAHLKGDKERDKVDSAAMAQALSRADAQPKWFLSGPASAPLRDAYTSALMALAESQFKGDRHAAWKSLDKLLQVSTWLNSEQRAEVYRWAGEMSFIEQDLPAAQDFLQRSLGEKDSADLRNRVEAIRSSMALGKKMPVPPAKTNEAANDDLGVSDEERDIFARMNRSSEAHDYLPAISDGVELIQKFPGSRHAAMASDRILDIYLSLSGHNSEKFHNVQQNVVKEMDKADGSRLSRWAANAFARGNYADAQNLAEHGYAKLAGNPDSTKVLLLAGKAAVASGEYAEAHGHFESLVKEHGGTSEAAEAVFRLGLLEFRGGKYTAAASYFERLLALSGGRDYEYRALYWQWRALQKGDSEKATSVAQILIAKYPVSYYGLRAQGELNQGTLELKSKPVTVKADFRFLESERLAWERLQILLKAGWLKEAEKELELLPDAGSPEELLIHAKLWAATLRYDLAIRDMNQAFEQNPDFVQAGILKVAFPNEYENWIAREGKAQGIGEEWIRSLIRQESSFRPDTRSPSNALGVMQLLPPTATELAHDLKLKNFQPPESLFDPEVNIKLGSLYLARLMKNFNGNITLALAAYNAGPGRLRRWLQARPDLGALLSGPRSSAPEVELWIDELPWDETSFYVKSILRNWLVYRLLDGSKLVLSDPIWMDGKPPSR